MASTSSVQKPITAFFDSPFDPSKMKPLMTSTPNPGPQNRKRKYLKPLEKDQMILDFGQKSLGRTTCEECGMVYSADDPKDKKTHDVFHNRFSDIKFFKVDKRSLATWKTKHYNEPNFSKVCGIFFKVENKARTSLKTKFEKIIKEMVDVQLDVCDDVPVFDEKRASIGFMFIVEKEKEPPYIGAVCVTERVYSAKLMPTKKIYKDSNLTHGYAAVERLWVHPLIRRQGIASRMLDMILRIYSPSNTQLMRSRIAFVEPNPDGVKFAQAFLNKSGKWIQHDGDEDHKDRGREMVVSMTGKNENEENNVPPVMKMVKRELAEAPKKIKQENNIKAKNPDVQILYKTVIIDDSDEVDVSAELPYLPSL